jgi:hypothetical protein
MLAAYFDDSGTQASSEVIVWGGFVGHVDQWKKLEKA